MAEYDLPDFVNKALEISEKNKLLLVGHSQGTTQTFAALAENENLQNKIEKFVALAPVLFMERDPETPNFWTILGGMNVLTILKKLNVFSLPVVNIAENPLISSFLDLVCVKTSFMCKFLFYLMFTKNPNLIDYSRMDKFLARAPSGCSVKSFEHYSQLMFDEKIQFHKFDYGQKNLEKYGQRTAPVYDLSKIKIPVKAFYGGNDQLCSLKDISFILEHISDIKTYYLDEWGHVGYLWGKDKSMMYKMLDEIF